MIKIKYVGEKVLKDYAGMNYYAAKAMGFTHKINKNTILIDKNLPKKIKKETIKHEKCEAKLMKHGMKYWNAHIKALKEEKK